jgi:hypothetical protein
MKKRYTNVYCSIREFLDDVLLNSGETIFDIDEFFEGKL